MNYDKSIKKLHALIANFEIKLQDEDLREQVRSLIPAFKLLNSLGTSLVPIESKAARDRILYYFQKYPLTVITKDEIMVVAGISEWARRLRELRVQVGWSIISGTTAREMAHVGEFTIDGIDAGNLKPYEYILTSEIQDKETAHRWFFANDIRKSNKVFETKYWNIFLATLENKSTVRNFAMLQETKPSGRAVSGNYALSTVGK